MAARRLQLPASAARLVALTIAVLSISACGTPAEKPKPSVSQQANEIEQYKDPALRALAEERAEHYGLKDAPYVEPIKYVKPEEVVTYVDSCMKQRGFPPTAPGSYTVPDSQEEAYNLARYTCELSYPIDMKYSQPFTEVHIGRIYDFMIQTEIPCLEGEGYVVNNVPSRDVFIQTYTTSPFWPYEQVVPQLQAQGKGEAALMALEEKCPQMPPSDVLYD